MLQNIRDLLTGWIAVAIVILLIIPFAFWGINYYFDQGTAPVVATVNDKDININHFQRAYSNFRIQMQALLGDRFNPDDDEELKQQTLKKLVQSETLNQAAKKAGLQISDKAIADTIQNISAFQGEDGFNKAAYEYGVGRLGMTPGMYEAQLRLDLATEQLQTGIFESVFVSNYEVENIAKIRNQKRDITYSVLSVNEIKDSITVTEEEIENHYNTSKHNYMTEEQINVEYIDLSLDRLAGNMEVMEEDLVAYYEQNKSKYEVAEQRKIKQLVVDYGDEASDEEINQARDVAERAKALSDNGMSFDKIAEEHSTEFGEDFQFIEHGFIGKGVLPEEVDSMIFNMQPGDISEILHTTRRFHIIQLEEIKGGEENTFENARERVLEDYRLAQAEEQYFELADELAILAFEHPDTLEIAAETLELTVNESGYFGRSGIQEGPLANAEVTKAAFSEEVLYEGKNSDLLELSDDQIVVIRVKDHRESQLKSLDEVRDQVASDIKFMKAGNSLRKTGEQILEEIRAGNNLDEIASSHQLEWIEKDNIGVNDLSVKRAIVRTAFSMGKPEGDQPQLKGMSLGAGDYAIIMLRNVEDPDSVDNEDLEEIRLQLKKSRATVEWLEFVETLEKNADISLYPDRI